MPLGLELGSDNYYGSYYFRVSIPDVAGDINQTFTKVSGVVSETEPMEFKHGTDPYIRKTVGRTKYEDLSLERIYNGNDGFYTWRLEIEAGNLTRKDIKIEMMKANGDVIRTMICRSAWPSKWQLPEMDSSSTSPASEVITLSVEKVTNE
jgi:phage tail-like protein